jgi:ammonia channel protein AmtB
MRMWSAPEATMKAGDELGKVVWQDLMTNEVESATAFPAAPFNWEYQVEHAEDFASRPGEEVDHPLSARAALAGSLVVTAAYHLGYTEFQGVALLPVLLGNAIITVTYLFSGSPLSPIITHVVMHVATVLHGMESTVQLPPHY